MVKVQGGSSREVSGDVLPSHFMPPSSLEEFFLPAVPSGVPGSDVQCTVLTMILPCGREVAVGTGGWQSRKKTCPFISLPSLICSVDSRQSGRGLWARHLAFFPFLPPPQASCVDPEGQQAPDHLSEPLAGIRGSCSLKRQPGPGRTLVLRKTTFLPTSAHQRRAQIQTSYS